MMNAHEQKLRDLELTQGNAETMDDFNEIFEGVHLDKEFWKDTDRCRLAKKLIHEQVKYMAKHAGRERFQAMDGPGNH